MTFYLCGRGQLGCTTINRPITSFLAAQTQLQGRQAEHNNPKWSSQQQVINGDPHIAQLDVDLGYTKIVSQLLSFCQSCLHNVSDGQQVLPGDHQVDIVAEAIWRLLIGLWVFNRPLKAKIVETIDKNGLDNRWKMMSTTEIARVSSFLKLQKWYAPFWKALEQDFKTCLYERPNRVPQN